MRIYKDIELKNFDRQYTNCISIVTLPLNKLTEIRIFLIIIILFRYV